MLYMSFIRRVGVFESCVIRSSRFWFSLVGFGAETCIAYWVLSIFRKVAQLREYYDSSYAALFERVTLAGGTVSVVVFAPCFALACLYYSHRSKSNPEPELCWLENFLA